MGRTDLPVVALTKIGWGEMVNTTSAFPLQAAPEQLRGPEHPRQCGSGKNGEIGVEACNFL